jgi:hypothetical protein
MFFQRAKPASEPVTDESESLKDSILVEEAMVSETISTTIDGAVTMATKSVFVHKECNGDGNGALILSMVEDGVSSLDIHTDRSTSTPSILEADPSRSEFQIKVGDYAHPIQALGSEGQQPGHVDNLDLDQLNALYATWKEVLECLDQWDGVVGGAGLPTPLFPSGNSIPSGSSGKLSIFSSKSKGSKSSLQSSSSIDTKEKSGKWSFFKSSSSINSSNAKSSSSMTPSLQFYSVSSLGENENEEASKLPAEEVEIDYRDDPVLYSSKNIFGKRNIQDPSSLNGTRLSLDDNSSSSGGSISSSGNSGARQSIAGHIPTSTFSEELWRGLLNGIADPDVTLLRFLRARKWNLTAALKMLFSTIEWRTSVGVFDLVRKGDAFIDERLLTSGKSFFHCVDKHGRTVIYVVARKHDKNGPNFAENQKFTVYLMELARKLMYPGTETVTLVFDLTGFTMANMDLGQIKFLVNCFQSFYPESLGKCYIVSAPWIFWTAWKIIKPLLDPVVSSKVFFLKLEELPHHIDQHLIAKSVYDEPTPNLKHGRGGYNFVPRASRPDSDGEFPSYITPEKFEQIKQDFVQCKDQLIQNTRTICNAFSDIQNLPPSEQEPKLRQLVDDLAPVFEQRKAIKRRWNTLSVQLDGYTLPETTYHRSKILDPLTGEIDWGNAFRKHDQ